VHGPRFSLYAGNFVLFAPYGSPFLNSVNVGGHILIVAGNGLAFGTHHVGCAFGELESSYANV
jgi:hypothetical protein